MNTILRLGHDNHRRLSKLYAWKEKHSKTSCGAQTVDYEKIATAAVQPMKAADVHRFLRVSGFVLANPELKVVCALVSDLYCPGYDPRQSLAKDSNLARTAARYKVDSTKITVVVRAEMLRPKNKHEQKLPKKITPAGAQQRKD